MSMLQHSTRAWGSPSRYIQGRYELENMKTHTEVYGRRVFFLIDVFFFADYKKRFEALYAGSDSQIQCEQFGGQDQVQFPDQGSTQAVRNHAAAKLKFTQMGYSEYNYGGNAFYMAKHYFKMGKKDQQNGLAIDMGKYIQKGKSSTITLTFDAAPVVSIDGTGSGITLRGIDDTAVTVEVYEGPGTVDSPSVKQSASLSMSSVSSWNQWVSMKVTLYGVTDRSRIVIRSTQFGVSGYHRWYLDNIKMVKAPRD